MNIDLSFFFVLDVLAWAGAVMLGFLFLTAPSKNRVANVFLGVFLWSLSMEICGVLLEGLYDMGLEGNEFQLLPTSLLTIPLLFLYVDQTIHARFNKTNLLWLIPGMLAIVLWSFGMGDEVPIRIPLDYLFNIGLLLITLFKLKKHRQKVNDFYSDLQNKTLSWIKAIVFIYLGFHMLWIVEDLIGIQNEAYTEPFALISTILTFFMVYWIGYNGFSQYEILTLDFSLTEGKQENNQPSEETIEQEREHFHKIETSIKEQKLFADSTLTLSSLAEALEMKDRELSRLINQYAGANFYQYINRLRTQEFKILIESPKAKQLSILGLAQEAGFSSKSTFYTAFKASEGMTPKQYEQRLKKSE